MAGKLHDARGVPGGFQREFLKEPIALVVRDARFQKDRKMNSIDTSIVLFFNSLAQKSWTFDAAVTLVQNLDILKGGLVVALFWWQWLRSDGEVEQRRDTLLRVLIASFVALISARALALLLPYRHRPIHTVQLPFNVPYTMDPESLSGWSSFPSDHATLFCTFAFGLFFISHRSGLLALLYTIVVILLPRIYLGIHWPTDLLAGLGLGSFIAGICAVPTIQHVLTRRIQRWRARYPTAFPVVLILVTFELGVLFVDVRNVLRFAVDALQR